MPGMFASSTAGGQCMGNPDVCLTPSGPVVVPVPYPNIALLMMAVGFAPTVFLAMMPALVMGCQVPMTNGDQGGASGGVASGSIMGPCKYTMSSSKVRFGGKGAVMVTGSTMQNQTNTTGVQIAPSQTVVMVSP